MNKVGKILLLIIGNRYFQYLVNSLCIIFIYKRTGFEITTLVLLSIILTEVCRFPDNKNKQQ